MVEITLFFTCTLYDMDSILSCADLKSQTAKLVKRHEITGKHIIFFLNHNKYIHVVLTHGNNKMTNF